MFKVADELDFDDDPAFFEFSNDCFGQSKGGDGNLNRIEEIPSTGESVPSSSRSIFSRKISQFNVDSPINNVQQKGVCGTKEVNTPWQHKERQPNLMKPFNPSSPINHNTSEIIGKTRRQRRFPGPAGLLPLRNGCTSLIAPEEFQNELRKEESDPSFTETEVLSQGSGSVFETGAWSAMLEYLGPTGLPLLKKMNLESVKAVGRHLRSYKVPFLAVLVQSIDSQLPDAAVVFKDPVGEMPGVIHREVWDQFGVDIVVGSVLVLRNVGIINAGSSSRKHVINITGNNLTAIFSSKDELNLHLRKIEVSNESSSCSNLLFEWEKVESQSKKPLQSSPQIVKTPIPNLFTHHPSSAHVPTFGGHSPSHLPPPLRSPLIPKVTETPPLSSKLFSPMPSRSYDQSSVKKPHGLNIENSSFLANRKPHPVQNSPCFTMKTSTVKRKFSPKAPHETNFPSVSADFVTPSSSKKVKTSESGVKAQQNPFQINCDDSEVDSLLDGIDTDSLFNDF